MTPHSKWILLGIVALAVSFFSLRLMARPLVAPTPESQKSTTSTQPKITWSEKQVEVILSPGESTSKPLTFTSSLAFSDAVIEVVPEVAGFLAIQPGTIAGVPANQPQQVTINFAIPSGATLGTFEGTIHVRTGSQTLPATLKVVVNVWDSFADPSQGIAFKVPPSISVQTREGPQGPEVYAFSGDLDEPPRFAMQAFAPDEAAGADLQAIAAARLDASALISSRSFEEGVLVEAATLSVFHYFQRNATSGKVVEIYGAGSEFFESPDFGRLISTLRF